MLLLYLLPVFLYKFQQFVHGMELGFITRTSSENKALFKHVTTGYIFDSSDIIETIQADLPRCGFACIKEPTCRSFNIHAASKTCKLLSIDRNTASDSVEFTVSAGWTYYDTGFDIKQDVWRRKSLVSE